MRHELQRNEVNGLFIAISEKVADVNFENSAAFAVDGFIKRGSNKSLERRASKACYRS
jgi:hypothetical protein